MENQNLNLNQRNLKLKISRIINSTLGYCNTRCLSSSVVSPALKLPQRSQLIDLFSPRLKSLSSTNLIRQTQLGKIIDPTYSFNNTLVVPRRRVNSSDHLSLLLHSIREDGGMSPPPTPITPHNTFLHQLTPAQKKPSSRYPKNNRKRKPVHLSKKCDFDKYYQEFYSSYGEEDEEDEEEETTLFTSRSDTSTSFRRRKGSMRLRSKGKGKLIIGGTKSRNLSIKSSEEPGKLIMGGTNPGFPVIKTSKDPYSDFRDSMVLMVVEKQLFSARDLEKLLQTYLSLNSMCHHEVIMKVYAEIRETLFSSGA